MAVLAVSFRLEEDSTYEARYESLVDALHSVGAGNYWEETTSFVLVKTSESIDDFCHRIYYKTKLLDTKDMFLVIDVNTRDARARGPIQYPNTLKSLLPGIQLLSRNV